MDEPCHVEQKQQHTFSIPIIKLGRRRKSDREGENDEESISSEEEENVYHDEEKEEEGDERYSHGDHYRYHEWKDDRYSTEWKQDRDSNGKEASSNSYMSSISNNSSTQENTGTSAVDATSQINTPTTTVAEITTGAGIASFTTALPAASSSSSPAIPRPQPTLTPERIVLLTSQAVKAKQRAIEADQFSSASNTGAAGTLLWLTPRPGDTYTTGDQISLQWNTPFWATLSVQLRLCVLKTTADLQGAHGGTFADGACGMAVGANSSQSASGTGWQVTL